MLLGGKYLCKIFIDHNKLNGRGRAELIVLYLAPPFFPGDGGRCRVFYQLREVPSVGKKTKIFSKQLEP